MEQLLKVFMGAMATQNQQFMVVLQVEWAESIRIKSQFDGNNFGAWNVERPMHFLCRCNRIAQHKFGAVQHHRNITEMISCQAARASKAAGNQIMDQHHTGHAPQQGRFRQGGKQ